MTLTTFTNGTLIKSSEVNDNFTQLQNYVARTQYVTKPGASFDATNHSACLPINTTTALALLTADRAQIRRTTNNGTAWATVHTVSNNLDARYICPANTNYSVWWNDTELCYTTDGGVTWTDATYPTIGSSLSEGFSITSTGRLYVVYVDASASSDLFIKYSDNDGGTWTQIHTNADLTYTAGTAVILSPVNGVVLYSHFDNGDDSVVGYTNNNSTFTDDSSITTDSGLDVGIGYYDSNNYYMYASHNWNGGNVSYVKVNGAVETGAYDRDTDENKTFPFSYDSYGLLVATNKAAYPLFHGLRKYTYTGDTLYLASISDPIGIYGKTSTGSILYHGMVYGASAAYTTTAITQLYELETI
jgi:hypothetical protein